MAPTGGGDSTHDPEERIPIVKAIAGRQPEADGRAMPNGMRVSGND
jgi:hypothetical protein